jgi:hypothetical protein
VRGSSLVSPKALDHYCRGPHRYGDGPSRRGPTWWAPWWVNGYPRDDVRRVGRVLHLYWGDLVALDGDGQVSLWGRV